MTLYHNGIPKRYANKQQEENPMLTKSITKLLKKSAQPATVGME